MCYMIYYYKDQINEKDIMSDLILEIFSLRRIQFI